MYVLQRRVSHPGFHSNHLMDSFHCQVSCKHTFYYLPLSQHNSPDVFVQIQITHQPSKVQFNPDRLRAPTRTPTGWTWRRRRTAAFHIFQLGAAMLMMCSGWWCTETLHMPLPWCENGFSLSDDIKPRLHCVVLWTVILKSMHTLHALFFFPSHFLTDLFFHTAQVAGLTLTTLSKITLWQYTQSRSASLKQQSLT